MKRLLLFDIDGTLLRCGPQVRPLFASALEAIFGGVGGLDSYEFAGKTDPRIVMDLMADLGHDEDTVQRRLPEMRSAYLANLENGLERDAMTLLPGVVSLLDHLAAREDVLLGLLTGNWHEGARIKLSRFDLYRYFRFGAFGDDAVCRRELAAIALERAAHERGEAFDPQDVVVIGDTVRDVDCAHAVGVACLAVTTGFTKAETLRSAGADHVFDDLEHARATLDAWL